MTNEKKVRLRADFNGLFGAVLCLSYKDHSEDADGNPIPLHPGMEVIAFDEDENKCGQRDDLIVAGIVEASPEWLQCHGSRWALRIDENGVRNESELHT